tara:strand:- start:10608 stop:10826 length:219 start_codon:yes stop_codon:yes gene_type:complete
MAYNTKYENVRRDSLRYAEDLKQSIVDGTLNDSACEDLLESFIVSKLSSQSARSKIMDESLTVIRSRKFLSD